MNTLENRLLGSSASFVTGFGFSIRGGKEFQSMPLFVLRIAVDGPAAADGRLRVGDQVWTLTQFYSVSFL